MEQSSAQAQDNAMTEIALALAMGFFSIMILTMISMGAGKSTASARAPELLAMAPPAPPAERKQAALSKGDLILIYDGKRFLDTSLKPVDPAAAVRAMPDKSARVILALDPSLSIKQAMAARRAVDAPNLVVSSLDERWIRALARASGGRR